MEINTLKDEIRSVKADIAMLNRKPPSVFPRQLELHIGDELKSLKKEIHHLRQQIDSNVVDTASIPSITNHTTSISSNRLLKVTTWNCRGLQNASPYLNQLIDEGSDIIAVSEHWLWRYQISTLNDVHPGFEGFGVADERLHENSELTRGCGGVGIIWNRNLQVSPVTNLSSDRICSIRLSVTNSPSISIIAACLPSSDHPIEDFEEYLNEVVSISSALETEGPVIIVGNFNVHLRQPRNRQGELLLDAITHSDLHVPSVSCIAKGPDYTFFSDENKVNNSGL